MTDPSVVAAILRKERQGSVSSAVTVGEELFRAVRFLRSAGIETAELDAQVLLAVVLGVERSRLFTADTEELSARQRQSCRDLLVRRAGRIPLPYIIGRREFWSRELAVDNSVLIPRPETETLVEAALGRMNPGSRLLDLGTGSGNVVIAIAGEVEGGGWIATDICPRALAIASQNLERHGLAGRVTLRRGDLFSALPGDGIFDVIVSNPPYIETGELAALEPEIRCHEPRQALDGGVGGLDILGRIIAGAPARLERKGWLLLEIGADQGGLVLEMIQRSGSYGRTELVRDLAGRDRVAVARRK